MTDLDRKIAELKGWRPEKPFDQIRELDEVYWLDQNGKRTEFAVVGFYHCDGAEGWDHGYHVPEFSPSCNIAQAFELVDEVCIDQDNKKGARFHLIQWEAKIGIAAHWEARIEPYWIDGEYTLTQVGNRFDGRGQTRPEAICRAYIALREWEGKK